MALFTNAKKTQHKIFSSSLFYLDTVLTQSFEHYSVWLYTFHINLQIVRWGRRNSQLWAKIRNFGCEMVIKKVDQKKSKSISISTIFSKIPIEIDRKFVGAYRPITTTGTPVSIISLILSKTFKSCSIVDLPFRNPYCLLLNISQSLRYA